MQNQKNIFCIWIALAISPFTVYGADYMHGVIAAMDGNYRLAYKEWKPLAEQNDASPQFQVGWLFEEGLGVSKNLEKAFYWYQRAAENGYAYAQTALGRMYEFGRGVKTDRIKAYMWYSVASEHWDPDAHSYQIRISRKMTANEINNAQKMSTNCINLKFKRCDE